MPPLTIKELILRKIEDRIKQKQNEYAEAFIDANIGKGKVKAPNTGLKAIKNDIKNLELLALKVREDETNE